MIFKTPAVAAVSATSYGIKVAVADERDELLDYLEVPADNVQYAISFLKEQASVRGELALLGCPFDPWPWRLKEHLNSAGHRINWIDPQVLREVLRSMEYWNRLRRLHRARTIAHIHRVCCNAHEPPDPYELTLNWENQVAQSSIKNRCALPGLS